MSKALYFTGIDIASENFTASLLVTTDQPSKLTATFQNSPQGFEEFQRWLLKHKIKPSNSVFCMEATGVYGEHLCYWLTANNYRIAVEPPLKVKRAFKVKGHKTDPLDAQQIAEYALRFQDKLHFWQPKADMLEQIRILLTTREQFVQQKTANINSLHTLKRKVVQTPLANEYYESNIERLSKQIKNIEKEIQRLIDKDQHFKKTIILLKSIPGVSVLLAANLLVATDGFRNYVNHKQLAAYIGICPYEHRSGSSVYKKPRSARYGPARLRKLLCLAARSVKTHKKPFQLYFLQ
ncbi:MAG: IS110 family transposase, partial [Thiotrichaceae bacterium]|nr:IS110 family transposase [Thiotrichaceae bacterium]